MARKKNEPSPDAAERKALLAYIKAKMDGGED